MGQLISYTPIQNKKFFFKKKKRKKERNGIEKNDIFRDNMS